MRIVLLSLVAILAGPVTAHEFWISPEAYKIEPGETMSAELRVGEGFKGAGYAYIPENFTRFDLVQGDTVLPVEGRIGDRPALNVAAPGPGLWTVVHVTRNSSLTYRDWPHFQGFTEHKDFVWAQDVHLERGFKKDFVRELYTRFGKSLIAVGDGAGADRAVGLETEIVALGNPYTDDIASGLPVRVLFRGAPRKDAQVEIYARAPDGTVTVEKTRTDGEGVAVIPLKAGYEYLIDSVVMAPIKADRPNDAQWWSLWASLTFEVPE